LVEKLKIRIIGGPNGSGKSYFINEVKDKKYFFLKNYVNADDIEKIMKETKQLLLTTFNINATNNEFLTHIELSTYEKEIKESIVNALTIIENKFELKTEINSYHSAIIADFVRTKLLESNQSFVYETVMSHISKVDFLKIAKEKGYKIYFYFLCTESVDLNKLQVKNRVALGGHNVPEIKIEKRYPETLNNLISAIELSDICFCINNKGSIGGFEKVAEIVNGENQNYISLNPPNWFQKYYLNKIKK
jgi:predicted ABC-type ATPase